MDLDKITDTLTVENGNTVANPVSVQRYQLNNHLESASLELDENADIISYEEYYPFGSTSYRAGRSNSEVNAKRYRYVGKEKDNETGLYYYGARYYASWLARFVSVDPLKDDYPQLNSYNYAGNKPITHKDLEGLQSTGDKPNKNHPEPIDFEFKIQSDNSNAQLIKEQLSAKKELVEQELRTQGLIKAFEENLTNQSNGNEQNFELDSLSNERLKSFLENLPTKEDIEKLNQIKTFFREATLKEAPRGFGITTQSRQAVENVLSTGIQLDQDGIVTVNFVGDPDSAFDEISTLLKNSVGKEVFDQVKEKFRDKAIEKIIKKGLLNKSIRFIFKAKGSKLFDAFPAGPTEEAIQKTAEQGFNVSLLKLIVESFPKKEVSNEGINQDFEIKKDVVSRIPSPRKRYQPK